MSSPFGFGAVLPTRAALWSRATSARLQVRWGKTSAAERFDLGAEQPSVNRCLVICFLSLLYLQRVWVSIWVKVPWLWNRSRIGYGFVCQPSVYSRLSFCNRFFELRRKTQRERYDLVAGRCFLRLLPLAYGPRVRLACCTVSFLSFE